MFTAARTRSVTQAVQTVAYKALAHLRYEHPYMEEARATRFFPQYPTELEVRYYEDANGEVDPAVVGLTHYVKALDTITHTAMAELDAVRSQLRDTEDALKMVIAQNQATPPAAAPQEEVHDITVVPEEPAPGPPKKRRLCYANSREYVRRFTGGAGPSRPTQDPAPADDEEEEDPEEVIPIADDDEEQEVF